MSQISIPTTFHELKGGGITSIAGGHPSLTNIEVFDDGTVSSISESVGSPRATWKYKFIDQEIHLTSPLENVIVVSAKSKGSKMSWTISEAQGLRSINESNSLSPLIPSEGGSVNGWANIGGLQPK